MTRQHFLFVSATALVAGLWLLSAVQPVLAQTTPAQTPGGDPISSVARGLKLRTDPASPPDWVVNSRKPGQDTQFIPTGAAARTEPGPLHSLDKLKEIEKTLDTERARHDRLGRRKAAPPPKRSVAIAPIGKKTAAKRPCVLTCVTPIGGAKK